jgi:hypothetical protein
MVQQSPAPKTRTPMVPDSGLSRWVLGNSANRLPPAAESDAGKDRSRTGLGRQA